MRALLVFTALVGGLALVGCGNGDDESAGTTDTETETTTPSVETATLRLYFVREGKVWPVAREVGDILFDENAVDALLRGPTEDERELGLETALPADAEIADVRVEDGVATVALEGDPELSREALAQIVYTETAFPGVDSVAIAGDTYTRADFEDQTPSVLVESPLPFDEVESPLRVTGTANTFEATFHYELTDTDGRIVDEDFVTATSGSGTRGTFDFTTDEYEIPFDGMGSLIVFERSAEDGSRIHLVEIPLRMSQ
jgi:germination protein M